MYYAVSRLSTYNAVAVCRPEYIAQFMNNVYIPCQEDGSRGGLPDKASI